jgi:AAA family ATP:ADP antiporter
MLIMVFLICFNYYTLRIVKDTFVVTAPQSGAETLPFLKVWAVLPMALLMTFIFTRFSNYLSRRNVFYAMMWFYIAYFVIFTLFLYPNRDSLHPHELADTLQAYLPKGMKGLIALFRNWTFTTFYVMAEMWSTMIMTVLFWGFANDVTSVKDAKRFYGLLALGTNLSGIVAGIVAPILSSHTFNPLLPFGADGWDQSVTFLNLMIIGVALVCIGIYWWLNSKGLGYTPETEAAHKESSVKMGVRKNFSYLMKSRYLILIAVLVITTNIVLNLSEVVWKDQVNNLYPNPADFNAYTGNIVFWSSIIAVTISIFISGNVIRSFGWTTSALIAPVITLITSILFFTCLLMPKDSLLAICATIGSTPLILTVFFGSLQNSLFRGTKYSLTDATKELAFVPLSQESKSKGKAAIDGVGSRLGKSGGALVYQILLMLFGSITGSTPIVAGILLLAIIAWIISVKALGKQFNQLTTEKQVISISDEEKAPDLKPLSSVSG